MKLIFAGCVGFAAGAGVLAVLWMWRAARARDILAQAKSYLVAVAHQDGANDTPAARGARRRGWAAEWARLADSVRQRVVSLEHERDVLVQILQRMTTGVVFLDANGEVRLINQAAERMFRRPAAKCLGADHWVAIAHYPLCAMLDRALLFGEPWQGELKLRDDLTVAANVVPLGTDGAAGTQRTIGHPALVLLNDVSQWHRLERMRSDFVANVSHELKTPITAIRGFVETLLEGDVDPEAQTGFLQVILDESVRMEALVSDLLTLSKLEAEGARVDLQAVPLADVIASAVLRVQGEADKRDIRVHAEDTSGITVWADEAQLLQVLLNLLTNAIHYTPPGGEVRIWAERLVDRVKIHVTDTGIGIAPEHLPRIFERFYRVDKDRSRLTGGTGLGLSIVKHIVSLHGGEVGVNSRPGEGSDFWFTLAVLEGA